MSGLHIVVHADTYAEARQKAESQAREFYGPLAQLDFSFDGAYPLVTIAGEVLSNKVEFTVLARHPIPTQQTQENPQ